MVIGNWSLVIYKIVRTTTNDQVIIIYQYYTPVKTLSGLLNIDKPAKLTSHDVVAQIRRLLVASHPPLFNKTAFTSRRLQLKVGHTGTLDPFATGVLLVAIGSATRLIEYSHAWDKEYHATFILGASSDTDDITGSKSEIPVYRTGRQNPKSDTISKAQIQKTLNQFIGSIQQTPPAYSAVRIAGERAYNIARRGIKASLAPRLVTIHDIKLTAFNYPSLSLTITCSTGTYIRSLARDLGIALKTGAYVQQLRRTRIGPHKIADSVKLNQLNLTTIKDSLLPATTLVAHLPKINLSDVNVAQFIQGRTIGEQGSTDKTLKQLASPLQPDLSLPNPPPLPNNQHLYAIYYDQSSTLMGVGRLDPSTHLLYPLKVLQSNP